MFLVSHDSQGLSIRFAASLENIDRVIDYTRLFLEKECRGAQWFNILLLMREALTNAVRHGCGSDPGKTIFFGAKVEKGFLAIEIEDEGTGFDWRSRINTPDDCRAGNGHGMSLLKKNATEFAYNEAGNRLFLRKRLG